jgi:hypothetical protein
VSVATFARRFKGDRRRVGRCDAKKRKCGSGERFARHCARSYHFVIAVVERKKGKNLSSVKYGEIIADNLSKRG